DVLSLKKLDLELNFIQKLPESLGNLKNLKELNLKGNNLSELCKSFVNLQSLEVCNLNGGLRNNQETNVLTELPPLFSTLTSLKKLYIANNRLEKLPKDIGALKRLEVLVLSGGRDVYGDPTNYIKELPESIGNLSLLKNLRLGNLLLKELPQTFGNLQNLTFLDLVNNQLETLPVSFGNLSSIEKLSLRNNQLTSLNESFGNLHKLEILDLGGNELESLPKSFGSLESLNTLRINLNNLKNIPKSFKDLSKLKILDLNSANLEKIPDICKPIIDLPSLEIMLLSKNPLSGIPKWFSEFTVLKELYIEDCGLDKLGDTFKPLVEIKSLEVLGLTQNGLKTLPSWLAQFTNLKCLRLASNNFEEFPTILCQLNNLEELELQGHLDRYGYLSNKLTTLPECIGKMTNLRVLNLMNNQINQLPDSIGGLKKLEVIDITGKIYFLERMQHYTNRLDRLPKSFCELEALKKCIMPFNRIKELPQNFGKLKNLEVINFHNNELEEIPSSFFDIPSLLEVDLSKNSIKSLPAGNVADSKDHLIKKLDLSYNKIDTIPEKTRYLKDIEDLDLSFNPLPWKDLPEEAKEKIKKRNEALFDIVPEKEAMLICKLEYLIGKRLAKVDNIFWETKNQYDHKFIQHQLGYVIEANHIVELGLCHKFMHPVYPMGGPYFAQNQTKNLFDKPLEILPENIGDLSELRVLDLERNNLKELPDSIGQLKNLEEINLVENNIVHLPESIGNLTSLKKFLLHFNELEDLPESFGNLQNLKTLELQFNLFKSLPESFGNLKNLEYLNLAGRNHYRSVSVGFDGKAYGRAVPATQDSVEYQSLRKLPESIGGLKSLKSLNLKCNDLRDLPRSFAELKNLKKLNLENNTFSKIPLELGHLINLRDLNLSSNQWKGADEVIAKNVTREIVEWCRKQADINILIIYAIEDSQHFKVARTQSFLENQQEIYQVFYYKLDNQDGKVANEDTNNTPNNENNTLNKGNNSLDNVGLENFIRQYLPKTHLALFMASNRSVNESTIAKYQLDKIIEADVDIIPVRASDISWSELEKVGLSRKLGIDFIENDFESVCSSLKNYILQY
ncbi:MAG: hypothetical protein GF364_04460, partial [Candidatus Lokiarchaeota archaeon]|nr:hypothetical protein [Candidatus Lokiarchaeota archaeon]